MCLLLNNPSEVAGFPFKVDSCQYDSKYIQIKKQIKIILIHRSIKANKANKADDISVEGIVNQGQL